MRLLRPALFAAAALIGLSNGTAQAAITYDFDLPLDNGSVTGTITTDGTTGQLSASNFTSWSLNIVGLLGASDVLTQLNSAITIGGAKLTADANRIYFDFTHNDAAPSYFLIQQSYGSGTHYACSSNATYNLTPCLEGTSAVPGAYNDGTATFGHPAGLEVLASVTGVPEASTWAMMIAGLAVVGMAMRRQRVALSFA